MGEPMDEVRALLVTARLKGRHLAATALNPCPQTLHGAEKDANTCPRLSELTGARTWNRGSEATSLELRPCPVTYQPGTLLSYCAAISLCYFTCEMGV